MQAKPIFRDRTEAGRALASALKHFEDDPDVLVLALPRGGLPVAVEVARALGAPLDVFVVRKLGVPGHEELAMGAIASGDRITLNDDVVSEAGVRQHEIDEVVGRERRELLRRERAYRGERPPPTIEGRTVILIDDGLATGASMRAAVLSLREQRPKRLVVAVPVAAARTCGELRREADEVICFRSPEPFLGVGVWYADFSQTTDAEVSALLKRASEPARRARP